MIRTMWLLLCTLFLLLRSSPFVSAQALPPGFTIGTDGRAEKQTQGFWINHTGLNVNNLTASMAFYGDVLGMRHIFTIQYTEHYSLTYMGFAQGGRNGTGHQTGAELMRFKNNSGGLIKLLFFSESDTPPVPSTKRTSTVANLGLVVPDLAAAQKRFKKHAVKIVKPRGVETLSGDSPVAIAFNIGPESTSNQTEVEELVKGLQTTDFGNIVFIEDPDGNLIEVIERDGF